MGKHNSKHEAINIFQLDYHEAGTESAKRACRSQRPRGILLEYTEVSQPIRLLQMRQKDIAVRPQPNLLRSEKRCSGEVMLLDGGYMYAEISEQEINTYAARSPWPPRQH